MSEMTEFYIVGSMGERRTYQPIVPKAGWSIGWVGNLASEKFWIALGAVALVVGFVVDWFRGPC